VTSSVPHDKADRSWTSAHAALPGQILDSQSAPRSICRMSPRVDLGRRIAFGRLIRIADETSCNIPRDALTKTDAHNPSLQAVIRDFRRGTCPLEITRPCNSARTASTGATRGPDPMLRIRLQLVCAGQLRDLVEKRLPPDAACSASLTVIRLSPAAARLRRFPLIAGGQVGSFAPL